jgi:Holliday junction resolvase-like predicted endonuclease
MKRSAIGRWGEQAAAEWLEQRGYHLLARNWRRREGEIDLVALEGTTLVFIEVKTPPFRDLRRTRREHRHAQTAPVDPPCATLSG